MKKSHQPISGLPPIIHSSSRILILGSMPGEQSLKLQQYYGNPRNQFWMILAELFNGPLPSNYPQKKAFLIKHRIAVWDVLKTCERRGSMDAHIRRACVNDLPAMLARHPRIEAVFCNGTIAFKLLNKEHPDLPVPVYLLPSSSPALAKPLAWKRRAWAKIQTARKEIS